MKKKVSLLLVSAITIFPYLGNYVSAEEQGNGTTEQIVTQNDAEFHEVIDAAEPNEEIIEEPVMEEEIPSNNGSIEEIEEVVENSELKEKNSDNSNHSNSGEKAQHVPNGVNKHIISDTTFQICSAKNLL